MKIRNIKLQLKEKVNSGRRATITDNVFLTIGAYIILAALICIIVNLDRADSIVKIVMPFMVAGIYLSYAGFVVFVLKKKQLGYKKNRYECLSKNRV